MVVLGQTSGLQGLGSKGFEMLCTGQGPACLPSRPVRVTDHRKSSDSKGEEGCTSFCRGDFAVLIPLSLGVSRSFAKGMGRAADEKV